ncbi:MAG: patatin-like phospholipase family protein [Flavobacteriaceae bacterium]|nr:patatin-like phospholipase family protein [Flavobacteriaceae bacterium]
MNFTKQLKQISWLCVLLVTPYLQAQDTIPRDIKVGLVLSGGGAKGFAHIGALKVIEDAGIRIDYIGGTSMGAIVGALYASGYSANELDSIFRAIDFNTLIQDGLPRSAKTFYEKEDAERYLLTLPFNKFKISFPSAISKGQNVYNLLFRLTNHVSEIDDFSKLPIPFFCMATDIETGESVVLESGFLPEAIAASGAFPSLFEPVTINGRMFVDGGVVNNYPLDELKARGADVVIGIDVQDRLLTQDELKSATDILLQISNLQTGNSMKDKVRRTDIYIKPNIEAFNVVSFAEGEAIINNGILAAELRQKQLDSLARIQKGSRIPHPVPTSKDSIEINQIKISGIKSYTREYVLGKLKFKPPTRMTYQKFNEGLNNLAATNNFKTIKYQKEKDTTGNEYLKLNLTENPDNTFLRLGLHYDDLYKSAAMVNVTKRRFLTDNDVASLDVMLGDNVRYSLQYYIDRGFGFSFGINSDYNQFQKSLSFINFINRPVIEIPNLEQVNKIDLEYSDLTSQIYLQTLFRQVFSLGAGLEHKRLRISTETISLTQGKTFFEDSDFYSFYGFLKFDSLDDRYFPTKGVIFEGDFHHYFASSDFNNVFEDFSIGKAHIMTAFKLFPKLALQVGTEGGFRINGGSAGGLDFLLGGYGNNFVNNIRPFFGYDFLEIAGDSYVKAEFEFDYEFLNKNHFSFAGNFSNIGDGLFETNDWIDAPEFTGYAIGYGLETFIGPIEIKYTWSPDTGNTEWFFNLGFWF